MGVFGGKKEQAIPKFRSRAEAFAYMLTYQMEEKCVEAMEAAKMANEFADVMCKNLGIPIEIEQPKEGVDRIICDFNKVVNYCEEHPKAVEFLTGALSGIATLATGFVAGKNSQPAPSLPAREPIDFGSLN